MPDAYVKRVRVTEQVSDAIGFIGPIEIQGDDPNDLCVYINVAEYIDYPATAGISLGLWQEQPVNGWYPTIGKVIIDPYDAPTEETLDMWVHLIFQPVDQRLP